MGYATQGTNWRKWKIEACNYVGFNSIGLITCWRLSWEGDLNIGAQLYEEESALGDQEVMSPPNRYAMTSDMNSRPRSVSQ